MPKKVHVPKKIARHWGIDSLRIFQARYKYGGQRIFKFAFQPNSRELLFDTAPTFHDAIIWNNGKTKFDDYIRGICFWDLKIIYLRGHENVVWIRNTKDMLRQNGIPRRYRIIWGPAAAQELQEQLKGL